VVLKGHDFRFREVWGRAVLSTVGTKIWTYRAKCLSRRLGCSSDLRDDGRQRKAAVAANPVLKNASAFVLLAPIH
jgi:hypothetical protein